MDKQITVLFAEDDAFIREIYLKKLPSLGINIVEVDDGEKALKKLEEIIPDIILLDINMPRMDGLTCLEKIKENEKWNKIKIIVLSNFSDQEKVDRAMELGADDYLIKSNFTPTEVVEKLRSFLDGK